MGFAAAMVALLAISEQRRRTGWCFRLDAVSEARLLFSNVLDTPLPKDARNTPIQIYNETFNRTLQLVDAGQVCSRAAPVLLCCKDKDGVVDN